MQPIKKNKTIISIISEPILTYVICIEVNRSLSYEDYVPNCHAVANGVATLPVF